MIDPPGTSEGTASRDSLGLQWLRWLAREDTAGLPPQYLYGEYVIARDALPTLKEILGWSIEGERRRFEHVKDLTFIRRIQTALYWGDPEDTTARRSHVETVQRVYIKPPDRVRTVSLGLRSWDSETNEEDIRARVEVRDSADRLTDIPFFFRELADYDFRILDRTVLPERVIYKVGFVPRSEFEALPEGWFLVDTRAYQILHAEFSWTKNVPYPVFLKAVDRVEMTRRPFDDVWLADRTVVVLTLRKLPMVPMPSRAEVRLTSEDVVLNAGLPDSVFAP